MAHAYIGHLGPDVREGAGGQRLSIGHQVALGAGRQLLDVRQVAADQVDARGGGGIGGIRMAGESGQGRERKSG